MTKDLRLLTDKYPVLDWQVTCASILLITLGISGAARADEWYLKPTLSMNMFFNDNRRLAIDDHNMTLHKVVTASADMGVRDESTELKLTPKLRSTRISEENDLSSEDETLDSDDQSLAFSFSNNRPEQRFNLDGLFSRDTRNSSESVAGVNEPEFDADRRKTFRVTPGWSYRLNERNQLNVTGTVNRSWYNSDRTPVRSVSWNGGWTYNVSPTSQLAASLSNSRVTVPVSTIRTNTDVFQLRYVNNISATWNFSANLSKSSMTLNIPGGFAEQRAREYTWGMSLAKSFDRGSVDASVSRGVSPTLSPTASGFVILNETVNVNMTYRHSEKLSGKLGLNFNKQEGRYPVLLPFVNVVDTGDNNNDRRRATLKASMSWNFDKNWALTGNYSYLRNNQAAASGESTRNILGVTLAYKGDVLSLSR